MVRNTLIIVALANNHAWTCINCVRKVCIWKLTGRNALYSVKAGKSERSIKKNWIINNKSEIIIYNTEDGKCKVDVRLEEDTVWLTQEQMAELFQKAKSTINEHIQNIYSDGELKLENTMRKFGNSEFSTKPTNYYNRKDCTDWIFDFSINRNCSDVWLWSDRHK
uniref:Virulence protein n=1 Tax=Eubacterium cellulosolvens (strain ATCC 43171 / JCM 9499 / 6) TaxID=633697 RepID=I5AWY7_EUBC6